MVQKILFFLFALVLLSSCAWDNTESLVAQDLDSGLELVSGSGFSIAIPKTWDSISDTSWLLPSPHTGSIELAARSGDPLNGLANNILVLSDTLNPSISAEDFLNGNENNLASYYSSYVLLDKKQITYSDDISGALLRFEAKYNQTTPNIQFLQATRVCDNQRAYTITIALPSLERESIKYQEIIQTFRCVSL